MVAVKRKTATSGTVRFVLDGQVVALEDVAPTRTVLNYLREDLGRTGTKEGCAEGDCGACTVVLAELDGAGVRFRAVNACIQFVPTLDGKELLTVESLKRADGTLHPVQQGIIDAQGFQCAFCMPGFIMATVGFLKTHPNPTRSELAHGISGNLCRCQDYDKILTAMMRGAEIMRRANGA